MFLAFTTYDESRAGSRAEALAVLQLFETAQLVPVDAREELSGELICYARSVVGVEWPAMEEGGFTDESSPRGPRCLRDDPLHRAAHGE